jgi:hypothetical protein
VVTGAAGSGYAHLGASCHDFSRAAQEASSVFRQRVATRTKALCRLAPIQRDVEGEDLDLLLLVQDLGQQKPEGLLCRLLLDKDDEVHQRLRCDADLLGPPECTRGSPTSK